MVRVIPRGEALDDSEFVGLGMTARAEFGVGKSLERRTPAFPMELGTGFRG